MATDPLKPPALQDKVLLGLVLAITVLFVMVLWPLVAAISWAVFLAILFSSLQERTARAWKGRRAWAALATVLVIMVSVLLPMALLSSAVAAEAGTLVTRFKSGDIRLADYFQQLLGALPTWARGWLDRVGIADLPALQAKLAEALGNSSEMLTMHAFRIGKGTLDFLLKLFVMIYVLFFLLRDGPRLAHAIETSMPLERAQTRRLMNEFANAVRATVKGNLAVALMQGALGWLAFWFLGIEAALLWGAAMALLSLLPAVGSVLVWGPVALYLAASGRLWAGIGLGMWGLLVVGFVDYVIRPILVGKETSMPDWLVLVATLGGLSAFGVSGFVVGPVIAALFLAVWDLFSEARRVRK